MNKAKRQQLVLDIISKYEVDTQEEFIRILQNKGVNATQATLSRDIKDLGLVKTAGEEKKFRYALPKQEKKQTFSSWSHFKSTVLSVECAQNLVVIKTLAANANAIGALIDAQNLEGILGTIAGDDTVLVITKDLNEAQSFVDSVKEMLK